MTTLKQITDLENDYRNDAFKACKKAIKLTASLPINDRIDEINNLLKGYGTEALTGNWQNGYWCNIVAVYVNMGDTYNATVIHVRDKGLIVCSYGDFIEKYGKKYGIE